MNIAKCPQCNNALSEEEFLARIDPKKIRSFAGAMAGAAKARTSEQAAARAGYQKENQVNEPNLSMTGFPTLRFRFAKTMAHIPHWYVVRSPENEADYVKLYHTIGQRGVWEEFQDHRYLYWYPGDGYKYWAVSPVINRAKV